MSLLLSWEELPTGGYKHCAPPELRSKKFTFRSLPAVSELAALDTLTRYRQLDRFLITAAGRQT